MEENYLPHKIFNNSAVPRNFFSKGRGYASIFFSGGGEGSENGDLGAVAP
jgi:hypothetical protein